MVAPSMAAWAATLSTVSRSAKPSSTTTSPRRRRVPLEVEGGVSPGARPLPAGADPVVAADPRSAAGVVVALRHGSSIGTTRREAEPAVIAPDPGSRPAGGRGRRTARTAPPLELRRLRDLDLSEPPEDGQPAHIASASGIAKRGGFIYVVGDDLLQIGVFKWARRGRALRAGCSPGTFPMPRPSGAPPSRISRA